MPLGAGRMRLGRGRIVNAVFAAGEILGDEGAIGPRQDMIVERVDLTEGGAHFADLQLQGSRQRGEGEVALSRSTPCSPKVRKKSARA